MSFCPNCGKEVAAGAPFCSACGSAMNGFGNENRNTPVPHDVPKCTCCGHVGQWKVGPIFRPVNLVIGIVLMIMGFVPGLIYLGVVFLLRSNEKNREKICVKCNARNMFTQIY